MRNLQSPLVRDRARDFATVTGAELLRGKVLQVLLTEGDTPQSSGELPWRTAFGSGVHLLRHVRNDLVLAELARVRVRDTLKRWLPGVDFAVEAVAHANALSLRIRAGGEDVDVEIIRPEAAPDRGSQ